MSEEQKEVKEQKEEQQSSEITLKSKGDWRDLLEEPHLKSDEAILGHDSLDSLAGAYLKLKTKLSSKASVEPLTDEASTDDFMKTSEAMLNVKEDGYSKDFKHKDLAFKFRLPGKLVEPFMKEMRDEEDKNVSRKNEELLKEYSDKIKEDIPEEAFETRFSAGLKALGFTPDEYKELLPEVERNKPDLVKAIANLGKKQYSDNQNKILEDKSDLPTDPDVLRDSIVSLAKQRLQARLDRQDTFHIDERLKNVKLRYQKIIDKVNKKDSYTI